MGGLSEAGLESSQVMRMGGSWWADQASYHPGPDPGYELVHPNIYFIYELLEHVKGTNL